MTASLLEDFFPRELAQIRSAAAAGKYASIKSFYLAIARFTEHAAYAHAELDLPNSAKKESVRGKFGIPTIIVIALVSLLLLSWKFDFFGPSNPAYYVKSIGTVQIGE
jgi:hypothetical protein